MMRTQDRERTERDSLPRACQLCDALDGDSDNWLTRLMLSDPCDAASLPLPLCVEEVAWEK